MDIASRHEGRYLLPERMDRRPVGTVPDPDENERNWEACRALVENGEARWMTGELAPGIELARPWKT
jgi:hypothetical protein